MAQITTKHSSDEQNNQGARVVPRHVAVIMDGNGRWAERRGLPRIEGHEKGAIVTRQIVAEGARRGIEAMTVYSFSVENWNRPEQEVRFLMELLSRKLKEEVPTLIENGIRLVHIGSRDGLTESVLDDIDESIRATSHCQGMTLGLAWNYGARAELTTAARSIAVDAVEGRLDPSTIDEQTISERLYTHPMPDPDLLIRTGGEMRISNFLLWQLSYAELWVTQTLWPDFSEDEFNTALRDYATRQRRFGLVK